MNRRGFLKGLTAVVGGVALAEAIPLGRVWSFPKEIMVRQFVVDCFVDVDPAALLLSVDEFARRYYVPAIDELVKNDELWLNEVHRVNYALTEGRGFYKILNLDAD